MEKQLKSARLELSLREAWQALERVRVVDTDLRNGEHKGSVTQGMA